MFDVLPLSPERTWATCCSLRRMASALVHGDDGTDLVARHERGPHADDLARAVLVRHPLARHAHAGHGHAVDLAANLERLLARPCAGGDADGDLIGLRLPRRRNPSVDGVQADEVDADLLRLEADNLEAL